MKGKFEINLAWKYVYEISAGRKVMKGKWVYSVKYNDDGSVKLFKARWVGCRLAAATHRSKASTTTTPTAAPCPSPRSASSSPLRASTTGDRKSVV